MKMFNKLINYIENCQYSDLSSIFFNVSESNKTIVAPSPRK